MAALLKVLNKPDVENTEWFLKANQTAEALNHFLQSELIENELSKFHKVGSASTEIQKIILPKAMELGFESEKKGIFKDYSVSSLRPDYFLSLGDEQGIIMEVERGKTKANNMDLLDVWKCHICKTANCLFLVVPIIRQTKKGKSEKIFESVYNRLNVFFQFENHINVDAVFLFGY